MDPLSLEIIAQFTNSRVAAGDGSRTVSRISTDSRTLVAGDLFVALRGENFDGHDFIEEAAQRGAAGAIVADDWNGSTPPDLPVILVADTLAGYQQIAAAYRNSLPLKVVAITGSNGKTTTKDFVAGVLSRRFRITKTEGNFNNHIGVPRTLLEATSEHQIAVVEMGMNHPGEIELLATIAAPDIGLITNIGRAHIEFMRTQEAIAREKGMLAEAVGPDGYVVLNADDPFTESIARRTRAKVYLAGINGGSLRASDICQTIDGAEFTLSERAHRCRAMLPVPGSHMVRNAVLACAVGRVFGSTLEECAAGLASADLTSGRLQVKTIRGVQFIDDSYNANPDSTTAALQTLGQLETDGRRIAVLGAMAELGSFEEEGHREVGLAAAEARIDHLIAIGKLGRVIIEAAQDRGLTNSTSVETTEEAADLLADVATAGDLVLVKGSRSARTERVIEAFALRHSSFVTGHSQ